MPSVNNKKPPCAKGHMGVWGDGTYPFGQEIDVGQDY